MVKNSDVKLEYWIGFIPYFWIQNDDINFCRRIYILPEYYNEEFIVRLENLTKSRFKNLEIAKNISRIIFEDKDAPYDYTVQYSQLIGETAESITDETEDCQDSYIFDDPDNFEYYLRKGKDIYFQGCRLTDTPIRVNGADISYYEFNEYQNSINYDYIIDRMDSFLLNTQFVNRDIKNIYNVFHKKILNRYLNIELFVLPTIDNIMSYIDKLNKNPNITEKYIAYYILSESIYTKDNINLPGKYDLNVLGFIYTFENNYYLSPRLRRELLESFDNIKNYTATFYIDETKDKFKRKEYRIELLIIKKTVKGFVILSTGENKFDILFDMLKFDRKINLNDLDLEYFKPELRNKLGGMFKYYFLYAAIKYNIDLLDDMNLYEKYLQEDEQTILEFKEFTKVFNEIFNEIN